MSRNVGCLLHRPCASSPRSSPIPALVTTFLRNASKKASQDLSAEDATWVLRVADQHSLRATKIQAAKFIQRINALQSAAASVPTEIHNPEIKLSESHPVSYKVGLLREKVRNTTPQLAQNTIAAAENVRAHLNDLQSEEYVDRKDAEATAMREFEREIEGWSHEKKEDTLRTWKLEEEGRLSRLNDSSKRLVKFVNDVLRRGSSKEVKVPAFSAGESKSVEMAEETEKRVVGVENEKRPVPAEKVQSPSLTDLQKQLEASVNQPRQRKS